MFLGFRSRWTKSEIREKSNHGNAGKTWKMMSRVCSHLYLVSGDVKGRTWSVPGDLQDSAQESKLNPPRTGRVRQRGGVNGRRSNGNRVSSTSRYLLQGGSTQLDGDVSEEAVSLCAEIPDDVWVRVGRSEELHFTFCDLDALWQDSLHGHVAAVKVAPEFIKREAQTSQTARAFHCMHHRMTVMKS